MEFDARWKYMLTHPSDGLAWKHFDEKHLEKAEEARHAQIAIGTDGFNPFGLMEASYSCWPVFFMPLNLPPSEIMKRKNIFLTLIIPGPKYPGKNMDVYMQPLKEELQQAWDEGFKTYDAASKKTSKCMFGTSTRCMTCRRMRFSLAPVFMEGSHAQHARQLFSFIG